MINTVSSVSECKSPIFPSFPAAKGFWTTRLELVKIGWKRAINKISIWITLREWLKHKVHSHEKNIVQDCIFCQKTTLNQALKMVKVSAEKVLFLEESVHLLKYLPTKKLKSFKIEDGILYYTGRLKNLVELQVKDVDIRAFLTSMR